MLNKDFVADLRQDGTFNEEAFEREYESVWGGAVEGAFFSSEQFDRRRVLNLPEYQYNNKLNGTKGYYVLGVDVGRQDDLTEIVVIKVTYPDAGAPVKQIVNLITLEEAHFTKQAIRIKQIFNDFHCRVAVVDANGLGAGLVDQLIIDNEDRETGETYWNWGVINDDENKYRDFKTPDTIEDALFLMYASPAKNSEMYSYCKTQMKNGRLRFLIDENAAKNKLMGLSKNETMSPERRAEYLRPFVYTSILRDQLGNLVEAGGENNPNIVLKPASSKIKKDKVSALIYGLHYCDLQERKAKGTKRRDLSGLMFYS